jgi:hypothetical protein
MNNQLTISSSTRRTTISHFEVLTSTVSNRQVKLEVPETLRIISIWNIENRSTVHIFIWKQINNAHKNSTDSSTKTRIFRRPLWSVWIIRNLPTNAIVLPNYLLIHMAYSLSYWRFSVVYVVRLWSGFLWFSLHDYDSTRNEIKKLIKGQGLRNTRIAPIQ